jgi:hypothetical protein
VDEHPHFSLGGVNSLEHRFALSCLDEAKNLCVGHGCNKVQARLREVPDGSVENRGQVHGNDTQKDRRARSHGGLV